LPQRHNKVAISLDTFVVDASTTRQIKLMKLNAKNRKRHAHLAEDFGIVASLVLSLELEF
jgi:hypothetical protein